MHRYPLALTGLIALALAVQACGWGREGRPAPVQPDQARSVALEALPFAELDLPPHSRPNGDPPERIPLNGPWKYGGTTPSGLHKWSMDVPIRPRSLFFFNPQPGMVVTSPEGAPLAWGSRSEEPSWSYNRHKLYLHLPEKVEPASGFTLTYPRAVTREKELNFAFSGVERPEAFVWTSIFDDWDSRRGLLLPAPGVAAWDVEVPPAGELLLHAGIVEPEILDAARSDGARLHIEVEVGGAASKVHTSSLKIADFAPVRVDLSKWAGETVRLRVRSDPAGDPRYDYVFLAEPTLASRSSKPRRVVLIFVDTLRMDHLSLYGYPRETSPKLDAWAEDAVVFEQARSVAPWTLPSARTVITGRHPEYYETSQTLQSRLAREGFATAMFAGNVYLSANFDMHRDWGLHRVGMFPSAEEVTNDALAWLDTHEGRDVMLQVHYMDPHLPYLEPAAYRYLFAGEPQGGLGEEFHLKDVRRAKVRDPAVIQYIVDRYNNNIRYATDQVARLLERLDSDDIVVFYSDHGEEFWDHGGFEHGHTLFDELLRVPFVVSGPGLSGKRIDAPVSLLDVTPTVLDVLGLPWDGLDGTSLLPAARGEEEALAALKSRDLAFGRPLYGTERWGVLHQAQHKWTTNEGREALYDVLADPREKKNLIANKHGSHGEPYHAHFSNALGVPVRVGYRLHPTHARTRPTDDLVAVLRVPGGVERAWVAHDPLLNSSAEVTVQEDELVVAKWHAGYSGSRDVYIVPKLPLEEVTLKLHANVVYGDEKDEITVHPDKSPVLAEHRTPLGRAKLSNRVLTLTHIITPVFDDEARGVVADDPEVTDMLKAMGYAVGD